MQAKQTIEDNSALEKFIVKDSSNFKQSLSPDVKNRVSTKKEDLRALYRKKKLYDRKKVKIRSIQDILTSPQKHSQSIFNIKSIDEKQSITKCSSIYLPKISSQVFSRFQFSPIKIFQQKNINSRSINAKNFQKENSKLPLLNANNSDLSSSLFQKKYQQKFDKESLLQKFRQRLQKEIKEFNFAEIQDHIPKNGYIKTKFKKCMIEETSNSCQDQNISNTRIPSFLMKWLNIRQQYHA